MRRRRLLTVPVLLASMAFGAATAQADASLKMYRVTVDANSVGVLTDLGVDLSHTGYKQSRRIAQTILLDLIDAQRARHAPTDSR